MKQQTSHFYISVTMANFEFTEDEIRKELENLGYFNVHSSRLADFKRGI